MKETKPLFTVMQQLVEARGMTGSQFMRNIGKAGQPFRLTMNVDPRLSTLQLYASELNIPTDKLVRLIEQEGDR